MLLTMSKGTLQRRLRNREIIGRWYGNSVLTCYRYADRSQREELWYNDFDYAVKKYTDISKMVMVFVHNELPGLAAYKQTPNDFRKIIADVCQPQVTDYTWMQRCHLWALRMACYKQPAGTWTRMRAWLLRRKLSNAARVALGGRPGRLSENQSADDRQFRRVHTDRKPEDEKQK
jgi:hypothetical protein